MQPFFYYRKNGNGNGGSRVTLALEKFVDEEKFKALLAKLKQMGFRYAGEGAFEGQRFEGLEEFDEVNSMVVRKPKAENRKSAEQSGGHEQSISVHKQISSFAIFYWKYADITVQSVKLAVGRLIKASMKSWTSRSEQSGHPNKTEMVAKQL